MRLDLYLQETRSLAEYNQGLLEEVRQRLLRKDQLSSLEQRGVLHVLQVLIENAIGKARHTLKHLQRTVPISAYDVFSAMKELGVISGSELNEWAAVIGLRNKIVHDYMKIDIDLVLGLVKEERYKLVTNFLMQPFSEGYRE